MSATTGGDDFAPDLDGSLEEFAVSPEDLVDKTNIDLEELDHLQDDRDVDDDNRIADWERLDYPRPEPHGQGLMAVLNDSHGDDPSAYRRFWKLWQDRVGDPEDEPHVLLEDVHLRWDWLVDDRPAHLVLKSKAGPLAERVVDGDYRGRRYEYSLQVMPADPEDGELCPDERLPVSFQTWVQVQDEDLVYKDGSTATFQYGEGTMFRLQTTYAEPVEEFVRLVQVVNAALQENDRDRPDWSTLERDSLRIWKAELYHRVRREYMSAVVQRLRSLQTIVEHGGTGDVDSSSDYHQGAHVEERVVSDMWDRVGFVGDFATASGYNLGLKVYRIAGNPDDERLQAPKVEAFLEGTDGDQTLPHMDEWPSLKATLRQMTSALCARCSISLGQLREDDFYEIDTEAEDRVDTLIPRGWRAATRAANEERERRILEAVYENLSMVKWDILYVIAMLDGATYDQLEEFTGYYRDYIRERVAELKDDDILCRLTYPRVIVYRNEELRLNAAEKLQELYPDRQLDDVQKDAEQRREERRQQRQEREESDGADGSDDLEDDADAGDGDAAEWLRVERMNFDAEYVGRYLAQGDIDPGDAKIRIDRYDWLD